MVVLFGIGFCDTLSDTSSTGDSRSDGGADASQPEPEAEVDRVEQEAQAVFEEEVRPALLAAAESIQSGLAADVESVAVVRNPDGQVVVVFTMGEAFQLSVAYDSRHEYAIQLRDWMRAIGDTPFALVLMRFPEDTPRNAWATWDEKHPRH